MNTGVNQPSGWHVDPWQRAELRYWDGAKWTEHVVRAGQQFVDWPQPSGSQGIVQQPVPVATPGAVTSGPAAPRKTDIPLFGARGRARELSDEVEELRARVQRFSRLDVLSVAELEQQRGPLQRQVADITAQRNNLLTELERARQDVVATQDEAVLQEVGVYRYRHPLDDAVAYQAELARLRDVIKTMARNNGGAVLAATDWQVNGSLTEGHAMVRDFSKLMLRAYNAEADNLVRGLRPYKLVSAIDRLTKVANTIAKLGRTMHIRISEDYHRLRVTELELTADCIEQQAEQKERERADRERLKEEKRVQQEMEREKARLEKERQHYENALAALAAKGDDDAVARVQEQIDEVQQRIDHVDYRAANIRAGYVYVISNPGSFGEGVVKVGLTRRLEPRDRVRELGDASVPFRFDTHALFFSDDAVGIEAELHRRLADRRVNLVNLRREFFYVTPAEVKQHLVELAGERGELLEYEDLAEAVEYRQSVGQRQTAGGSLQPSP